jgi:hypothetical protein
MFKDEPAKTLYAFECEGLLDTRSRRIAAATKEIRKLYKKFGSVSASTVESILIKCQIKQLTKEEWAGMMGDIIA